MAKTNGKSQVDPQDLDLDHELPAGEESEEPKGNKNPAAGAADEVDSEYQKLRAERDTLLDRLARMQAEFENARKRAAREQQEFRDFATADAIKALLPSLDSFERALRTPEAMANDFRNGVELIYKQMQVRSRKWACARSRPKVSRSIRICMRRSRWWRPRCSRPSCGRGIAARVQTQGPPASAGDGEGRSKLQTLKIFIHVFCVKREERHSD